MDNSLARVRELAAGLLALLVVGGFSTMIVACFMNYLAADDTHFAHAMQLLGIVNPMVGVVIGYYFSRATSEARAENVEQQVKGAQAATNDALASKAEAEATTQTVKQALSNLADAADEVHHATAADLVAGGKAEPPHYVRLASRVADARKVLGQR